MAQDVMVKWAVPVGGVLSREFCLKRGSKYSKDIGKLGRKMERVIHIDHDATAVELHPENSIVITAYDGDDSDTELLDLIEFLKAAMHAPDVRQFIKKYGGDSNVGR